MRRFLIPAMLASGLVVSACGSSSDSTSSAPASSAPASSGYASKAGAYAPPSTSTAASTSGAAGQKLTLKANPSGGLSFEPASLKAKAGAVTLAMDNPSSSGLQHGIAIEGNGVDKDGQIVAPGSTSTVTVTLKPGTYEFYCPVPAHKAAGMTGKLVVG